MTLDELLDRAELGAVTAADLDALDPDDPDLLDAIAELDERHRYKASGWSSVSLYDDDSCEVAVFALSAGDEIPLHDHPGMTVLQRVLRGAVALDAWDLLDPAGASHRARHVGSTVADVASGTLSLGPTRANLHRVRALTDAVFVDVLTPPYGEGRRCSEWRVVEAPDAEGVGRLVWVRTL